MWSGNFWERLKHPLQFGSNQDEAVSQPPAGVRVYTPDEPDPTLLSRQRAEANARIAMAAPVQG